MKTIEGWEPPDHEIAEVLRRCREAVRSVVHGASVVLFGSYSRGEADPESDLDLLILLDKPSPEVEDRIRDVLYPIELDTGRAISLFLESKIKWKSPLYQAMPFVKTVEAEGVVL
jgi:predicted nucleotidyltransferase